MVVYSREGPGVLYSFFFLSRATRTKYHRLGDLNTVILFSRSSGGCKSKIQLLVHWVSSEASLLVLQMTVSLLCLQMAPVSLPPLRRAPILLD